jgi:hypothetical protein
MPRRKSLTRRLLRHVFLVSLASSVMTLLGRGWDEWDEDRLREPKPARKPTPKPRAQAAPKPVSKRRFAATLSFCALFFAGLAFSAGAGNSVRSLLDDNAPAAQDEGATTSSDASLNVTTTEAPQAVVQGQSVHKSLGSVARQGQASVSRRSPSVRQATSTRSSRQRTVHRRSTHVSSVVRTAAGRRSHARHAPHVRPSRPERTQPLDAEASLPGATVWLYQAAPDPTPPAARLRLHFARELVAYSRSAGVDWALVLAVLRTQGHNGRVPASPGQLKTLSLKLARLGGRANGWAAALALTRETTFADRTVALRHYYRAVGMPSLVYGLLSQKRDLEDRVLHDPRVLIYSGGRNDVATHKVDVRVLAAMLYLADTFHQVTVSCLISGHGLYARPGVVSAHIYGRAMDVSALGGTSIYGHQQPGGVTEQGVRSLLMLPPGLLPAQIISLLGLGGPSFPLANHYDHIHVGY